LEELSILANWFGVVVVVVLCLFSWKGSVWQMLLEDALLSSCAGLRCNGNLTSRPRRSRKAVFFPLPTYAVLGLLVQWLKLFPRMLKTQAGLCLLCEPFGFGRGGVSTWFGRFGAVAGGWDEVPLCAHLACCSPNFKSAIRISYQLIADTACYCFFALR